MGSVATHLGGLFSRSRETPASPRRYLLYGSCISRDTYQYVGPASDGPVVPGVLRIGLDEGSDPGHAAILIRRACVELAVEDVRLAGDQVERYHAALVGQLEGIAWRVHVDA